MSERAGRRSPLHPDVLRLARGFALSALASLGAAACLSSTDRAPQEGSVNHAAVSLGGLPALNIDVNDTSTSGLSAGAFMAVQFHVAYSSMMTGVGVFAGGPFDCTEGSLTTALTTCMTALPSAPDPSRAVTATTNFANAGAIDPTSNLAGQHVFLFGGADDTTVAPAVMDALESYYGTWTTSGTVTYEKRHPSTGHTMPTVDYGGDCDTTGDPWIGKCNYDGAGIALGEIYGTLQPKASTPGGQYVSIEQGAFVSDPASHSLADTGYAYIPASCANGERCRVHVAFHGCKQYATGSVGDKYYKHAGYNEWADTNHIVVLYPQTIATTGSNPNGCFDWWGYDSADYAKQSGPQMMMVRRMIDALAGGGGDAGAPDSGGAPDAGQDTGTGQDSGATDAGTGSETCILANNYDHVAAGRAHVSFGYALADGSDQNMGLYSIAIVTSLRQTGPDQYVIGTCP